jgi:hypothetical protein
MPRPFQLTPLVVPEAALQHAVLNYLLLELNRPGGRVVRFWRQNSGTIRRPDGGFGAPAYRLYLRQVSDPLTRGAEDFCGVLRDGRFFGIELKSAQGIIRQEQEIVAAAANRDGILHVVAKTLDDVILWMNKLNL